MIRLSVEDMAAFEKINSAHVEDENGHDWRGDIIGSRCRKCGIQSIGYNPKAPKRCPR